MMVITEQRIKHVYLKLPIKTQKTQASQVPCNSKYWKTSVAKV